MAPSTPARDDDPQEPPVITPGGTYTIQTISVGCKVYARRWNPDISAPEERLVEILSIRDKPNNPYLRRQQSAAATPSSSTPTPDLFPPNPELDKYEFFVHWDQFNKRLDEWLPGSRIVLTRDLEWPRPKKEKKEKEKVGKKNTPTPTPTKNKRVGKMPRGKENSLLRLATLNNSMAGKGAAAAAASSSPSPSPSSSPAPSGSLKRKTPHDEVQEEEEEDEDAEGEPDGEDAMDIDADADADGEPDAEGEADTFDLTVAPPVEPPAPLSSFSKKAEIEKLRTSGSMTQSVSEIARVKNLNRLSIGRHEVDAWYFSPYPQEYAHLPVLYICEFCLGYFPSQFMLSRHRKRCTLLCPPGNEIYRHDDISFFEIDGRKQLTYCRNLSLLSKCFLDHKTLYYDVTPFLYYVMIADPPAFPTTTVPTGLRGLSPHRLFLQREGHQRHGYGKLLIEFSYLLSRSEGKLGSPEKPLSDLGLLGYRAYWAEKIVEAVLAAGDEVSVDEIAQTTAITHADVMNTCTTLQLFKHYKGQHIICLSDAVIERYEKSKAKRKRSILKENLRWKPPTFTRDQLRFGW
ncbi:hypothetical protein EVG20_g1061 [Dentipellis fragilis]|uniref:histone acetyltransferase n=1 Tax=Dentipellis fragilis TaxID=205917 RepID=A0A4Y9ZDA5_9AGAM|nr:hypothetical protein EVG20_g1061 [Dentipellis fragilis]